MKQVEYGDTVTPPVGYEGRTWYDKSDPDKKVIDFENYPIVRDTTFVLHRIDGDDVYILNPLGEMNITLSKDEAIVTTCLFTSTKNGEYYNNVQMSFLEECDWIQNIDMIEDSANNTICFQFTIEELPQEIYENGRSVTAIIIQLDTGGVSREFEIRQFEYCPPIMENTTGATSLSIKLCGNHRGSVYPFVNLKNDSNSNKFSIYFMCNGTIFGYFDKNNTGGITISETNRSKRYVSFFDDDYGILFNMPGLNSWYGDGSSYETAVTFNLATKNAPSVSMPINIYRVSNAWDEIERMLIECMMENKCIRIPYDGFNGSIQIVKYPYYFCGDYFYQKPKITYFSLENNEATQFVYINNDSFSINGFNGELTDGEFSIKDKLIYDIEPNDTCDYKHHLLSFDKTYLLTEYAGRDGTINTFGGCLHFVQEYNVKNRIYYGRFDNGENFDDKYRETRSDEYIYHAWFEICSSKILMDNQWEYTTGNSLEFVAYPNSDDFEYNVSFAEQPNILKNNYMWGSKSYTIIKNDNNTITFTKKIE